MPESAPPPPNRHLQSFEELRTYFRRGRVPWSLDHAGVQEELRRGESRSPKGRPFPLRKVWWVSEREFNNLLRERFAEEIACGAVSSLYEQDPKSSAYRVLTAGQSVAFLVITLGVAAALAMSPSPTLVAFNCLVTAYFIAALFFRLHLVAVALHLPPRTAAPPLGDASLPVITILLPLFREAHAAPALIESMEMLDYPREKLDIKILLEQEDVETRAEIAKLGVDPRIDVVVVPRSYPQTKPKACNYGLLCAKGDLIVIYDAEDQPERDQLRKAAAVFAANDGTLACAQARLNYYNADENRLTRQFTLEYSLWFDTLLPALEHLKAPIPLGGTSNFFRTDLLIELGGWDPFNVTEDADLGLRLARRGYRTTIIDSTTFEEANCRTASWLRQRSRWMKGYIQTWLVHLRAPFAHRAQGGWRGAAATHLFVAGNVFSALINPFLWGLFIFWLVTRSQGVAALFPGPLLHLNLFALLFGNFLFIYLAMLAPLRRERPEFCASALFTPVYWLLSSVAAYMAIFQLATRPSYWEKTEHGLSSEAKARRDRALRQRTRAKC